MKIVFMGTSEFSGVVLEKLVASGYPPVAVVTAPDKPVGRKQILTPSPVKVIAQRYDISIMQPEKISNSELEIRNYKPELVVVAAYGQILPKEILEIPKYGCLNIHPSLLPKYRGATPVQFAILNGDKETGVSIILMDEQIDHGPILAQGKTIIGPAETSKQLHDRLVILGSDLLIDTIPDWAADRIKSHAQDEKNATYTKILTREDGKIDWKKSAQDIDRQIRAFDPWPGTYTFWERERKIFRIKVLKARLEKNELIIEKVQLEGKKPISFKDFIRSYPDYAPLKTSHGANSNYKNKR